MSEQSNKPNFDSIRQETSEGIEYWSARDLSKLLGYTKWENFNVAVKRARIACEQIGQNIADHLPDARKPIKGGKGNIQVTKDYWLSRFGAYLVAQNGDPRKPEIAAAQAYFATAARENELAQQLDQRLELRQRLEDGNKALEHSARNAGVLPRSFGLFHQAGYEGLYNGLGPEEIKKLKGVGEKENLADRMGQLELAANNFRATLTAHKLGHEGIIGQTAAMEAHKQVGQEIRGVIERSGGTMPEDLPAEPSIKPLIKGRRRKNELASETTAEESDNHDN